MYCTVFYNEMVRKGIHNCICLEIGIILFLLVNVTLSGRMGKVVASHAEDCKVARPNPGCG